MAKVGLSDISKITGFSVATVSNALNHKKGVNKKTVAEIFRVAKEIGYINENTISKIKLVIFKKNGSIIDDSPFFTTMINGFELECRHCGYEMVIYNLDQREPDFQRNVRHLIQDVESASVILGTELMDADLDAFKGAKTPVVLVDYWQDDMNFNSVLINSLDSARKATEYLIENGHREIGYLRGSYRIKAFASRSAGFRMALKKHEIALNEAYIITLSTTMNGAYQDMCRCLEKNKKLPTAFFADNDMIALGAMKALLEQGYRIPEDVSIIGFDDLPFSEISNPPLTTLRVPNKEMGRLAVRRVVDLIQRPSAVVTKTEVCTQFVLRETVRKMN